MSIIYALHQADLGRLDETGERGRTYREELQALARGELCERVHEWLGVPEALPSLSTHVASAELIRRIECSTEDAREHLAMLDETILARRSRGKSVAELLDNLLAEDSERRLRFRAINRRHSWALEAGLTKPE